MITINLIPEKIKQDIEFKKLLTFVNKAILTLSVLLFLYLIVFLSSQYILSRHLKDTKNSFVLTNRKENSSTNDIKNINKKIQFIYTMQNDNILWSKMIYDISLAVNKGISVRSFSLDKDKKMFNIQGKAKSREDLLQLKSNLENISYLSDIVLPLQSLFKKEDISFNINDNIKSYEFKIK